MTDGPVHLAIEQAANRYGDRPAILAGDRRLGFTELNDWSDGLAGHLAGAGVQPGSRVAIMTANRPEFIVAVFAVSKLGAASVLLSPAWKAAEIEHAAMVTTPTHAIADADSTGLLSDQFGADRVTDVDDLATASLALTSRPASDRVPVDPRTDAVLVFSSGTTGMPKAVRHTHQSIGAATDHWCAALGLGSDDRFQVATPPSHILGLLNLLAATAAGATVRLHRRFDLDDELYRIGAESMTLEMAVAPIALAMANHPELEKYDLSSLRYVMWGATPVTASVAETVTKRTGVRWLPAYGASELPVIAANPIDDPAAWRLDSAGLPVKGVELRVVDLDTGEPLDPGGVGEIQARSPSLMAGYLPDEANRAAFVGGWYRTGDVGWVEPEGWVHLTDRSKEMLKVNGFQVAPAEIEGILHGHPAVLDCAVFGVPDDQAGERPVAAVQLDPCSQVSPAELKKLVADSLANYKQLADVVVVDAIPRLPSGKVLRRALREELAPQLGRI
jgi:acyl-CoA synthetase (AMP-forming)/AMP-acid ligase II